MLTLLLIGMLTLAFNIQPVKAEPRTWTVDDDGPADFSTIQEAINAANPEDIIYVYNGTYYENVIVNKTVSLIGENLSTTILDGGGKGTVVYVTVNHVAISGFSIQNSGRAWPDSGILLKYSGGSKIGNNNLIDNHHGIWLQVSASNEINNNVIVNNGYDGILLWGSDGNTISNNMVISNYYGIWLDSSGGNAISDNNVADSSFGIGLVRSGGNVLRDNRMAENMYNFGVGGDSLLQYVNDIDSSNTADGKPIYYFINRADLIVDSSTFPDIGYLAFVNSTNITVRNLTLTNSVQGVMFAYTANSTIQNTEITNNFYSIRLWESFGNTIHTSRIANNLHGIWIDRFGNNRIIGNNITNNSEFGIQLIGSDRNLISGNNIANNTGFGINIIGSNENTVIKNSITNNFYGITLLSHSSNNTVVGNDVVNKWGGIVSMHSSSDNTIFHNNFIDNKKQVISNDSMNSWDDGYPSGGNYWSDYDGEDRNGDGIGDTPYVIDENNQDNYPLMEPWSTPTMIKTLIRTVRFWNLHKGTENRLTSKLKGALHLLDTGKENGAVHKLMGFIDQVESLREKKLTDEQADYLISEARRILTLIEDNSSTLLFSNICSKQNLL